MHLPCSQYIHHHCIYCTARHLSLHTMNMASRDHFNVSLEAVPVPGAVRTKKEESIGEAGEDRKRKKTMGRQKIEIKRIDNEEKRQVCFSKRKDGLFKKASDLSVLCGAHVAAVAFSPGGKPFSFGHTSVQAVIDRFTDPSAPATAMGPAPVHPALLEEVNREEDLLAKALATEASRKKALDAAMGQAGVWNGGVNDKSAPDLLAIHSALEKVQADVAERLQEFMAKDAMMQRTMGTDVSGVFHYPGAGTFMTDGGLTSHHDQVVMGTQMMMLQPYSHCFDLNHGASYGHGPVFGVEGYYEAMACNLSE